MQVPHTEVDLILINGQSVGFEALLQPGDRVSVYPMFEALDISNAQRLRPSPIRHPAFVCDVHLGALAKKMRLLGLDTLYRNHYQDIEIVGIQTEQRRTILTCDRGLLMHRAVTRGYLIRNRITARQVEEVLERFDLRQSFAPFTRCIHCNTLLKPASHSQKSKLFPADALKYYDSFHVCVKCDKPYWRGSHYRKIKEWVDRIY
jgi:uncharacterized protein with PIN domain